MPKHATPTALPAHLAPQKFEVAAAAVQKILGVPAHPCAGHDLAGLLTVYYHHQDARIKMNAIIAATVKDRPGNT